MPSTPTPDTSGLLDERVHHHRDALTVLMAGTGRCDDITSGALMDDGGGCVDNDNDGICADSDPNDNDPTVQ